MASGASRNSESAPFTYLGSLMITFPLSVVVCALVVRLNRAKRSVKVRLAFFILVLSAVCSAL